MSPRSHRSEARRGRASRHVDRTRLVLLVLVAALPLAAAQSLPGASTTPLPSDAPSVPSPEVTGTPAVSDRELDIHEDGLVFQGRAESPTYVAVALPDGSRALEYRVDEDGRARLDVAGTNALADATLVAVEGDPTGDAFTLVVRDAKGTTSAYHVDRRALAADQELPVELQVPAVEITRPPSWPGVPTTESAMLYAEAGDVRLAASELDGTKFLRTASMHTAAIQVRVDEVDFDRAFLSVQRADGGPVFNTTLARASATNDAVVYRASYSPTLLDPPEGGTLTLKVVYERRLAPLVVERLPEAEVYRYRVDGAKPLVAIDAPDQVDDFRFGVSWNGADSADGSGIRGFVVDYRIAGTRPWTRWLDGTTEKSAIFSGAWGATYEFRAVALDKVGNPSEETLDATRVAPAPEGEVGEDLNDPPNARISTPRTSATLAGAVSVVWQASDPDDTPVTSKLEVSPDEGVTWRTLYVGPATSAIWDTEGEEDGSGYELRLTVGDGTLTASHSIAALTIRNVIAPARAPDEELVAPPSPPSVPADPPAEVQPAASDDEPPTSGEPEPAATTPEPEKGVPMPFVGGAMAVAALLARRRRA